MVPESVIRDDLVFRRFTRRDIDPIADAVLVSLPELRQWLPWAHSGYDRDDAAAYVKDSVQAWKERRAYDFAIRRQTEPDRHLGNVSIWHVSRMGHTGEIGYWIRSDETTAGLATKATATMLDVGFTHLRMHKINLRIAIGNKASERVAEKLGFTREGILREELKIQGEWVDHTLYSLLVSEHERRLDSVTH